MNAYISQLPPPRYPFSIDTALAAKGHTVFVNTCATCHGTYAPDSGQVSEFLIRKGRFGTDDAVGMAGTTKDMGSEFVDYYNASWYGRSLALRADQRLHGAAARRRLGDRSLSP